MNEDSVLRFRAATPVRKLGWVLLSPPERPLASTRIAALNMMEDLSLAGFESVVLFAPPAPTERPQLPPLPALLERALAEQVDTVVFQKVHGEPVLAYVAALKAKGIKTVFLVCDVIDAAMTAAVDLAVVVSPYLRSLYPIELQHKVRVVHDGIERIDLFKTVHSDHRGSRARPLRAVLITSAHLRSLADLGRPPSWLHTEIVGHYPAHPSKPAQWRAALHALRALADWRKRIDYLRFMAHPRISTTNWTEAYAYEALLRADIGVIAVDTYDNRRQPPLWMRKSENRLTLKMALGLPVVASPVPAYLDVIEPGVTGFIARDPDDWRRCLEALRDPELRARMGVQARQAVQQRFSRHRQAQRLAELLDELVEAAPRLSALASSG
jgi:glycosyltransferase involved in cell wall biosynthesis